MTHREPWRVSTKNGLDSFGTEVRQFMMLPVAPQIFDWIQLRCIRRQTFQNESALSFGDKVSDHASRVTPKPANEGHLKTGQ